MKSECNNMHGERIKKRQVLKLCRWKRVKFTLEKVTKAQRGSRSIALLFL